MKWKAIGQSVAGTSHISAQRPCEDSIRYEVINAGEKGEILICCASDGAGSAKFGGWASDKATELAMVALSKCAIRNEQIAESDIFAILEDVYGFLVAESIAREVELNEFSCTFLGFFIENSRAVFFQIGDGAIIRNDGSGFFIPVWWPENGEYQNTTSFITDDNHFSQLNLLILEERVNEVGLFTDGLQLLALNTADRQVHQPFFVPLFRYLRLADEVGKINILNRKLTEFLDSKGVNDRTDDDKTLFLASRLEG